jgi:16S rRNA (uracil1498-N3)-methyltransferase
LYAEWIKHTGSSQVPNYLLDFTGVSLRSLSSDAGLEALFLSGPEGGLSPAERQAALDANFAPICLGPRVLRAETAPLVVLSVLNLPV